MTIARTGATATLFADGHVLIAGGISCGNPEACSLKELSGPGGGNLASAELYDPATGKFTRTGSMSRAAANTATLLPDGRVLMANGNDGSLTAEMYHPATGKFSRAGSLLNNYNSVNAVLLPTDKVLFAGPREPPRRALRSGERQVHPHLNCLSARSPRVPAIERFLSTPDRHPAQRRPRPAVHTRLLRDIRPGQRIDHGLWLDVGSRRVA